MYLFVLNESPMAADLLILLASISLCYRAYGNIYYIYRQVNMISFDLTTDSFPRVCNCKNYGNRMWELIIAIYG